MTKALLIVVPLLIALSLVSASAPSALAGGGGQVRPCGDARRTFTVDSVDALLILQVDAGLVPAPPVSHSFIEDWLFFNANLDDTINSLDALLVLQYTAGFVAQLPNCYDVK